MTYHRHITDAVRTAAIAAFAMFTSACPTFAINQVSATQDTAATTIVEDNDEDWTWTGMKTVSGTDFHKGSASAGGTLTSGVYVFIGTGVSVFGIHGITVKVDGATYPLGKMAVNIDGKQKALVDLSKLPADPNNQIFHIDGLPAGNHVLQVKVIEGWGAVDYISVQNGATSISTPDDGGKDYRIGPKSSPDKWLDSMSDNMGDDSALGIYSFPRAKHSQVWHVVLLGKGEYRISPKDNPDQAVTLVTRTADIDGTPRSRGGLYKYAGDAAQQWELVPGDPGFYRIVNTFDHRCLNVGGGKNDEGAAVILYQLTNGDNDQWRFIPVTK